MGAIPTDGRPHRQASTAVARRVALGAGIAWIAGFFLYARAPSVVTVELPALDLHPKEAHNLAAARFGPTIHASSYFADVFNQHHPAFLVDERAKPTRVEKWASDPHDKNPWVEIRWRGAHDVDHVVIEHAGDVEDPGATARSYTVTCLMAAGTGPSLHVSDNQAAVATHSLACPAAWGVRVAFVVPSGNDIVRVFEIAAWGR